MCESSPDAGWPTVAVVVPAYNEETHIGACLRGLQALDYPADRLSVVVVDNGSADRTRDIARELGATVLELPTGLVGAVRNHGVAGSDSEIVAFIDSDCVPVAGWLQAAVIRMREDAAVGAVGGSCLAPVDGTWLERAWAQRPPASPRRILGLAASSLILRREVFAAVGGFDETMSAGEDFELSRRLRAAGHELVLDPGCTVYHLGWPRSLREIYRRQVWQGANQIQSAKRPFDRALTLVHIFALAPVSTLVLGLVAGWTSPWTWLPLLLVPGVPLLASAHRAWSFDGLATRLTKAVALYPIFFAYYVGRTVGLVASYRALLRGRPDAATKTWTRD